MSNEKEDTSVKSVEDDFISSLDIYECHKKVRGAKIKYVVKDRKLGGGAYIHLENGYIIERGKTFLLRHHPAPGKYFVVYKDGYESVSPCEAFEGGYTKVEDGE